MKIALNKSQYRAVNNLRGLPQDAHMLIMCSRATSTGATLEGSEQAFEELVAHIGEELAYDMLPARAVGPLVSLCTKIDPGSEDWLGM